MKTLNKITVIVVIFIFTVDAVIILNYFKP